jgi:hypothetical protein
MGLLSIDLSIRIVSVLGDRPHRENVPWIVEWRHPRTSLETATLWLRVHLRFVYKYWALTFEENAKTLPIFEPLFHQFQFLPWLSPYFSSFGAAREVVTLGEVV